MSIIQFKKILAASVVSSAFICCIPSVNGEPRQYRPAPSANNALPQESIAIGAYFVRLTELPMSQWIRQKESAGATPSREQRLERVAQLKKKLADVKSLLETEGIRVGRTLLVADCGISVYATPDQIESLGKLAGVAEIVPKSVYTRQSTSQSALQPGRGGRLTQRTEWSGAGQTIAIIDGGVDYTHRDFDGNGEFLGNDSTVVEEGSFPTRRVVAGYDLVGEDYDPLSEDSDKHMPRPDPDPLPDDATLGHGTFVAGIAAGKGFADINPGIAPEASLMAIKVFAAASTRSQIVADGIDLAMDPNRDGDPSDAVDVINLSLGSVFGSPGSAGAVAAQNAIDSGIVVVAGAGNEYAVPYSLGSPAVRNDIIAVGGSTFANTMWSGSSKGPGMSGGFKPDISAPGYLIGSAKVGTGDDSDILSGTSYSAPAVAGAAALLRQKFPSLRPFEIKAILQNSSSPASQLEGEGKVALSLQGTGIINIEKALQSASYAAPGGIGFGVITPEHYASSEREFTLRNFSNQDKRYTIRHEPNLQLPEGAMQLSYHQNVYVPAGQSVTVPVTLHVHAHALENREELVEVDGWLVASSDEGNESSVNGKEELRVGYMAVVEPVASLDYQERNKGVNIRNDGFAEALVYPFTLLVDNSENVAGRNDIESFGFRFVEPFDAIFGVKLNREWQNFSAKKIRMLIDTNGDAENDFVVEVFDDALSYEAYGEQGIFYGEIYTFVDSVDEPFLDTRRYYGFHSYPGFVEPNNSVLVFGVNAYGYGGILEDGDTDFDYEISLHDAVGSLQGEAISGTVDLAKQVEFDLIGEDPFFRVPALRVPAHESIFIDVEGDKPTLWLSPTELHKRRATVLR